MLDFKQLAISCALQFDENELEMAVERKAKMNQSTATLLKVAPALAITAFVSCLGLLCFIVFALVRRRIPSRKYIVVISRVVADIFTSALITFCSFFATHTSASHAVVALFLFVATFSVLQLGLSHIYVIILRQVSVTRPYGFQSICSVRRVSAVVAVAWMISVLYAAAYTPLTTVVLDPNKDDVCSYSKCQKPLLIVCICLISFIVPMIIFLYAAVVWKLKKTAHSERMHNEPEVTKKKLLKFLGYGGHIILFSIMSIFIVIGAGLILRNGGTYNQIRKNIQRDCDVIDYINTIIRLEMVAGGALILWLVRIIFDVFIIFFCEYRRLLPWMSNDNMQQLRDNQIASRSHTLKWQKGCLNCPVFHIDQHLQPWDFKN